jgi:hypothetical protein
VTKLEELPRRALAEFEAMYLEAMYKDKLESRITAEFYDRKARELRPKPLNCCAG